ncbi:MAG: hypothetical protein N2691_05780 [Patescibacteria group bacterium]|nr:hypothetical protein [Patescibacteria group bacterium]
MAKNKKSFATRIIRFTIALGGIAMIGVALAYSMEAIYPFLIAPISLPMGTPILILGAIMVAVYFGMGIAIAFFAKKHLN